MDKDLKSYGIDAEQEMIDLLSKELAKNIDKAIIDRIWGTKMEKRKRKINKIFSDI